MISENEERERQIEEAAFAETHSRLSERENWKVATSDDIHIL